jgi:putative pyrroloquinoline-quinone-binding quinoprotein
MKLRLTSVCLLLLAGEAICSAENWPQFRGEHAGVATDRPSLPDIWSETQNVAWKIEIPGRGWSSPVVWGDHVFVTTAVNSRQPKQPLLRPDAYRGASMGGTMSRRDLVTDTDVFRWIYVAPSIYEIEMRRKTRSIAHGSAEAHA